MVTWAYILYLGLLEPTYQSQILSERKNINREWSSLFETHTYTHSIGVHEWERKCWHKWERSAVEDHLYVFGFLLLLLALIISLRKLLGFLLYSFPNKNSLRLLSLVIIIVHVILSDNILRSYWLNDKNLTYISVSCEYCMFHSCIYFSQ